MDKNGLNQEMNNQHDLLAQKIYYHITYNRPDDERIRQEIFSMSYRELQEFENHIEEVKRIEIKYGRETMIVSIISLIVSILVLIIRLTLL